VPGGAAGSTFGGAAAQLRAVVTFHTQSAA
jgi:hypothetical protein